MHSVPERSASYASRSATRSSSTVSIPLSRNTIAESHPLPPLQPTRIARRLGAGQSEHAEAPVPDSRPRYGVTRRFGGTPNTHVH